MDSELTTMQMGEPEFRFVECKFTIESSNTEGGDLERNVGGARTEKRVTFDGYATSDLYAALVDAIGEVVK